MHMHDRFADKFREVEKIVEVSSSHYEVLEVLNALLGTNISPPNVCSKMIFLFPFGGIC